MPTNTTMTSTDRIGRVMATERGGGGGVGEGEITGNFTVFKWKL